MWSLLKAILAKVALIKVILQALRSLGWLLPLAILLKVIGLPLLVVLLVLALPLLVVLAIIGLPVILVVVVGGALLTFTGWILSLGLLALKLALPAVAIYWILRWLFRDRSRPAPPADSPPPPPPPPPPPSPPPSAA